jgi:SAM-dependent methyltransferase
MNAWSDRYLEPLRRRLAARGGVTAREPTDEAPHPFRLHPGIRPTGDDQMRRSDRDGLNQLCDLSDWRWGRAVDVMAELGEKHIVYRKAWENAKCLAGLERLDAIHPDAIGLSVGAGAEKPLFWLANRVAAIHATDLYTDESGYPWGSDFLADPGSYSPVDFRREHLFVEVMSGTALGFADDTFDFAYSLSSIEHFGGHEAAAQAMREIHRVLRPGGVAGIATELLLSDSPHPERFTVEELRCHVVDASPLQLVEDDIDLRISSSLLVHPYDITRETHLAHSPHIVVTEDGTTVWTSIILFFRKPLENGSPQHS